MDKVVIRTENNQFSGLGHMIRCFWIASALQKLKVNVILITEKTKYAKKMSSKFNLKLFNSATSKPNNILDAKKVISHQSDLVIVDSKNVNKKWSDELKKETCKLIEICTEKSNISSVPKIWTEKFLNNKQNKNHLSGLKYVPLSSQLENTKKKNSNIIKKVLITFGGNDHLNLSLMCIECLNKVFLNKIKIYLIVGDFYKNINLIKEAAKNSHHKIKILKHLKGITNVLKKCNLSINASGTTMFELNIVGNLSLSFAVWKSQERILNLFKDNEKVQKIFCKSKKNIQVKKLVLKKLNYLRTNFEYLEGLKNKNIVDIYGAKRVAGWIKKYHLN